MSDYTTIHCPIPDLCRKSATCQHKYWIYALCGCRRFEATAEATALLKTKEVYHDALQNT